MERINHNIFVILIFTFAFVCSAKCQQYKSTDTIYLKEVTVTAGFTIDTSVLKILFVLEMQPFHNEPCNWLDFIVLYDNYYGIIFQMGPIININKIYWAFHQDSIIFFSSEIRNNKVKLLKQSDQIEKYILENGERQRIGSKGGGFDCLIQDTPGYYKAYSKFLKAYNYLFKKEEKLSNCKLEYYYRSIKK